jgi:tRNA G46 methylase TrmB
LIQPDFVEAAIRTLTRSGTWLIQSDHAEYFEIMHTLLAGRPELTELSAQESQPTRGPNWQGTNFEIKYIREGRTIYRAGFRRT